MLNDLPAAASDSGVFPSAAAIYQAIDELSAAAVKEKDLSGSMIAGIMIDSFPMISFRAL